MEKEEIFVRKKLVTISRRLYREGFVVAYGGNISVRVGSTIFIKRSNASFEDIKENDFIKLKINLADTDSQFLKTSKETLLHIGCYKKRKNIRALIHTHPPFATAFASLGKPLKPVIADFVIEFGKEVPNLGYIRPGSRELAKRVSEYIGRNNALLLKNHGIVTCGSSLKEAYVRTALLEECCKILLLSRLFGKESYIKNSEVEYFLRYLH